MLLTTTLLVMLYLLVIYRAVIYFRLPGETRDDDKTIAATIIAASVMFIAARVSTFFIEPWAIKSNSTSLAMWIGFGLFNAMLYLGLIHKLTEHRRCGRERRSTRRSMHHHPHHGETR